VTLSAAWNEVDLRALRGVLADSSHPTASATLAHLCRLIPAARVAIVERDQVRGDLVCAAAAPANAPRRDLVDALRQVLEGRRPPRVLTTALTSTSDVAADAWLVLMRDRGDFAEVDRITLELLRPHLAAQQRAARRRRTSCGLTQRERQVLALVARGYRNNEIARRLVLSPGTVRKHLDNAYRELGVSNRAAAVARAFPDGVSAEA
jgi:DNA-binding NarL/FixJ family response regulator